MKFFIGLLVGFSCGAVFAFLLLVGLGTIKKELTNRDLTLFSESKDCVTKHSLKVFQVLDPNKALVMEQQQAFADIPAEMQGMFSTITDAIINAPVMFLIGEETEHFYDEQIIKIPTKKCAKQVGIYRYKNQQDMFKTVPVVRIEPI